MQVKSNRKSVRPLFKSGQSKTVRRKKRLSLMTTLIIVVILTTISSLTRRSQIVNSQYFSKSPYKDINIKLVRHESAGLKVGLKYPLTDNDLINQNVASYIDENYQKLANRAQASLGHNFINISYDIATANSQIISLAVMSQLSPANGPAENLTKVWTFDRKTGHEIRLNDLFQNNQWYVSQLIQRLKNDAISKSQQPDLKSDEAASSINITPDKVQSFLVINQNTLEFVFNSGEIATPSLGEIKLPVAVADFNNQLQNTTANRFLNIAVHSVAEISNQPDYCRKNQCIALTFDDGPGNDTMRLLDILHKYNIKATFFLLGREIQKRPEVVRRMVAEGHEIGNHGWSHKSFTKFNPSQITQEIERTNQIIEANGGVATRLTRPPFGSNNQAVREVLAQLGQRMVLWTVDPRDWANLDASVVADRIIANYQTGSVVLMHDVHSTTVDAVEHIIQALMSKGYKLVTIPQLIAN